MQSRYLIDQGYEDRRRSTHLGFLGQDTADLTAAGDYSLTDVTVTPTDTFTPGFSTVDGSMNALTSTDLSVATGPSSDLLSSTSLPTIQEPTSSLAPGGTSAGSNDVFTRLLTGLGLGVATAGAQVATAYIGGAQLQATNAARMAQGLPPVNANGQVMTQAQMIAAGYSAQKVAQFSSQLSGSTSMLLLIAALAAGAFLLMKGRT